MTFVGKVFVFAKPDGWRHLQEGNRYIFHGPNHEELIVSSALIQGNGELDDLNAVRQQLFQNAEQSAKNAASHPALKITQPFQREPRVSNIECWSLCAQTLDSGSLFYQAVFSGPRGIMLTSLDGPNAAALEAIFEQFIKSVRVASESAHYFSNTNKLRFHSESRRRTPQITCCTQATTPHLFPLPVEGKGCSRVGHFTIPAIS